MISKNDHLSEVNKNYTAALEQEVNRRTKAEESLRQRTEELEITQRKLEESATPIEEYANQMEQLAKERLEQLRDSERLATIGQVAAMVGHDIRNPLQAIVSDIYLAESDLQTLPPSAEKKDALESLREIQHNVEYINKIVQDLQDYSKIIKPTLKEVNLETLCKHVLSRNSITQNIKTTCVIEDQVKVLMTDPDILMRILSNLVSNAVHAMPKGGKLTITASKGSNDIVITVEDTGIGITDEINPNYLHFYLLQDPRVKASVWRSLNV